MRFDLAFGLVVLVISGCARTDAASASPEEPAALADAAITPADTATPPADADPDVTAPDLGSPPPSDVRAAGAPPPMTVGTWNLHNFSKYGTKEFRIDDVAGVIKTLDVDVLGVEELKVADGTDGSPPQAFDELVTQLPGYAGINATWDPQDTTVGLLYRTSTTTLTSSEVLFPKDWTAFPRPPLRADVTVTKDGKSASFTVIVLHLKAFKDSVDRRREACQKLVKYIAAEALDRALIIGDLNDDPYDPPAENSYTGTFLDAEPSYYFVTASLPQGTVTSTGYHTTFGGKTYPGELLDHAIATGPLFHDFASVTPSVVSKPASEFDAWSKGYSDHFPLLIHFK